MMNADAARAATTDRREIAMKTNFDLAATNIELIFDHRRIDLHNNFNFTDLFYDAKARTLVLNWTRHRSDRLAPRDPITLRLTHKSTSYLRVEKAGARNADDDCLMDITYYPSSDRFENECIVDRARPNLDDDVIYKFEGGWWVRIKCDEIVLELTD